MKGRRMSKVSVIIPNYNGKKYLKDCLDAMKCQSFRDFEVLLSTTVLKMEARI